MKNKKTVIVILAACVLLVIAVIVGTIAFFTSNDEVTNTITVGNVHILLSETEYPGNDNSAVTDMIPYSEVSKNPQITNVGTNKAFVFLRITVPVRNVTEISTNGTLGTKQEQEIFYFKTEDCSETDLKNNFDNNWIELKNCEQGKDYQDDTRTYIFVYKNAISPNYKTEPLFDKVQLKNVIEEELIANQVQTIKIEALAIQSDYIDGITDESNLQESQLEKIYNLCK